MPEKRPRKRQTAAKRLDDARARMYRDLIFEAAEFVFGQKGFDGATMQDIASEAGVSLKTVYATFPGKTEIYLEIVRVRGEAMSTAITAARRGVETPTEKLESGTRAFVQFLFDHEDWLRLHVRSRLSWAMRPQDETVARLSQAGLDGFAGILRDGIASGDFCDEDPVELAVLVQALTMVQVSQALESGDLDAVSVSDRLVERLLRLVGKPAKAAMAIRETG
jgi:AcrR family transcriptional regulator